MTPPRRTAEDALAIAGGDAARLAPLRAAGEMPLVEHLEELRRRMFVCIGAVFVGYVQSTRDAVAERDVLGTDVAYFMDGKIHAVVATLLELNRSNIPAEPSKK